MTQNRSTAVMQRRAEPHDSLDDFPTPPWATRALLEYLDLPFWAFSQGHTTCREPAANRGHMVLPLSETFITVEAFDIFDYGVGFPQADYLFGPDPEPVDWPITNPPFRLAEAFIERALRTSGGGVAMIVRSAFLKGVGRYSRLFSAHPPRMVLQFTERVVMHKGRLSPKGTVIPLSPTSISAKLSPNENAQLVGCAPLAEPKAMLSGLGINSKKHWIEHR